MKKNKVNITNQTLSDMEDIYDYIAEVFCSPTTAMNQYNRITKEVLGLATTAEVFMLFDTEPEKTLGMRKLFVGN